MRHRRTWTPVAASAIALTLALAGCAAEEPTPVETEEPTAPAEPPEPSPTDDPTDDGREDEDDDTEDDGAQDGTEDLPPGFPDPDELIGQEAYDEPDANGMRTHVGGEPLDLEFVFGACFEGGTGETCAYSISASGPPRTGDEPEPAEPALLLLLGSQGQREDGTAVWEVLDAVVVRPPDDDVGVFQSCHGEEGVAVYPTGGEPEGDTLSVVAAWGADDDVSALVERDPAEVTCEVQRP